MKMLMEIDPLPMRGSLVMTMVMISPPGGKFPRQNSSARALDWRGLLGRSAAVSRRNLRRSTFAIRWSYSTGGTSLWETEIVTIVITNDPLIRRGSISINIFTSTISSQTLVHLLYPKPQIGTCGLLVVLITPCS